MHKLYLSAIILCVFLFRLSGCSEFHLDRQINSPYFTNSIMSINALENNTLALVKGELRNLTVTVLQGSNL